MNIVMLGEFTPVVQWPSKTLSWGHGVIQKAERPEEL